MRSAILSGAMAIPLELVDVDALRRTLTVQHCPMGEEETVDVLGYSEDDSYIYVPRQFGLSYCSKHDIEVEDDTSSGHPVHFPSVLSPRDYQADIIDMLVSMFDENYDGIFKAHTGWGKTIGSLLVASRLQTTTLIVVDQENLRDQWLDAAAKFGMTIENGHVGLIQGKRCEYRGKTLVVAMVQTLSQRQFPDDVYRYFGFLVVDEVHTVGAPTFSVILRQFPATMRLGVSATPNRKDGLQKLLKYNLGPVRVAADKEHNESAVYFVEHDTVYSWYGNVSKKVGRIISEVADDGARNLVISEIAIALYETGRDVLLLSDRTEHLKHLQSLLYYSGVDTEELGIYAVSEPIMRYAKEPKPKRRPQGCPRGAEYTPISLQTISKRIPSKVLANAKATARILLGTYGKCAKGFDEPRLAAGIDMTPRSEFEQIHGRILRELPDKRIPIWVTILDVNNYRLAHSFAKRLSGAVRSNGRIYEWTKDGEIIECQEQEIIEEAYLRAKEIRTSQIVTRSDGRNTLLTKKQEKALKKQRVNDTVKRIRSSRRG